jgi:hypothetical protein
MADELPTPRSMASTGLRWHVWRRFRKWSIDADFRQLIASGRGGVPVVKLRWRCGRCGLRTTDAIMTVGHLHTRGACVMTDITCPELIDIAVARTVELPEGPLTVGTWGTVVNCPEPYQAEVYLVEFHEPWCVFR